MCLAAATLSKRDGVETSTNNKQNLTLNTSALSAKIDLPPVPAPKQEGGAAPVAATTTGSAASVEAAASVAGGGSIVGLSVMAAVVLGGGGVAAVATRPVSARNDKVVVGPSVKVTNKPVGASVVGASKKSKGSAKVEEVPVPRSSSGLFYKDAIKRGEMQQEV